MDERRSEVTSSDVQGGAGLVQRDADAGRSCAGAEVVVATAATSPTGHAVGWGGGVALDRGNLAKLDGAARRGPWRRRPEKAPTECPPCNQARPARFCRRYGGSDKSYTSDTKPAGLAATDGDGLGGELMVGRRPAPGHLGWVLLNSG
jgi:hypothetical protein